MTRGASALAALQFHAKACVRLTPPLRRSPPPVISHPAGSSQDDETILVSATFKFITTRLRRVHLQPPAPRRCPTPRRVPALCGSCHCGAMLPRWRNASVACGRVPLTGLADPCLWSARFPDPAQPSRRHAMICQNSGAVVEVVEIRCGVIPGLCKPNSTVRRRGRLHHGKA